MMIIRRAQVSVVKAALTAPFSIATGQHSSLHNVFFSIELETGVKGVGEAAVATHITGETLEQTCANLKAAAAVCQGEDVRDYRSFLFGLREIFQGNGAGLAAVEMAVLDAWTRSLRIPLWKMFGACPMPLVSDITIVIGTLPQAAASAALYARQGFGRFKVKVGKDADLDLSRVAAVRQAAPRAEIILDANQGFSAQETLGFIKALGRRKIVPLLVEQPVGKDDWDGLKKVTRALSRQGILVCADESVKSLADAARAARIVTHSATKISFKINCYPASIPLPFHSPSCNPKSSWGSYSSNPESI
ncbi:MAG: enolase C-terminal domain-like protein, partial [Candidatus Omnitrophota bacterium]